MFSLVKTALAANGKLPLRIVPKCGPTGEIREIVDGKLEITPECTMDHLVQMGVNIVDTLLALGILVTVLFIIIGGFRMIISAGSPERIQQARANITSAITGLVIILIAWVVINTAITVLTDCVGEWYTFESFKCGG